MTLRRLKLLAILAPLLFLAALELARQVISPALFQGWPGYLLLTGIVLLGTLFFAEAIFGVVGRLQTQLAQQNQELLALHDAGLGTRSRNRPATGRRPRTRPRRGLLRCALSPP
jgi:hypothetical protein